jgi:hypothetical protein
MQITEEAIFKVSTLSQQLSLIVEYQLKECAGELLWESLADQGGFSLA